MRENGVAEKVKVLLVDSEKRRFSIVRELLESSEKMDFELEHIIAYDVALRLIKQAYHDVYLIVYPQEPSGQDDFFNKAFELATAAPIIVLGEEEPSGKDIELLRAGAEDFLFFTDLTSLQLERAIRYSIERKLRDREIDEFIRSFRSLSGEVPMCAKCGKIKNLKGEWQDNVTYIKEHSGFKFSHGLCGDCAEELYGSQEWYNDSKGQPHTGVK